MKILKKLTASILIASLALSNLGMLSTYAKEENNVNQKAADTNSNPTFPLELNTLKIDKKTYKPGDTIKVSLKITDDKMGINELYVQFSTQSTSKNIFLFLSYNYKTGLYEGEFNVNSYIVNGSYSLSCISYWDDQYTPHDFTDEYYNLPKSCFNVENDHPDLTAPTLDLNSLKLDKKSYKPGEEVKVSIKAYDNESGISSFFIMYTSQIKSQNKVADFYYNSITKLYEGTIYIDEETVGGTWEVNHIYAADENDNYVDHDYDYADYDFSKVSFNVENDAIDIAPPTIDLDSLNINTKSFKTGEALNISFKAYDDKSSPDYCELQYSCNSTDSIRTVTLDYNSQNNLYTGKLNIDSSMEEGSWSIDYIYISDSCDNTDMLSCLDYDFSNADFYVDNNETDTVPPELYLNTLKIDKNNVKPGDTITASLKATDNKSGIDYISLHYVSPDASKNQNLELKYNSKTKLYEGKLNIDAFMDNGTWSLDYIFCSDKDGNSKDFTSSDYDFSEVSFNVENDAIDTIAPTIDLNSLKVDKSNVKPGDKITVSVKAFDDKSGIEYIYLQYVSSNNSNDKRLDLKYNSKTGLYEGTIDIDTFMNNGIWSIYLISCSDKAGNNTDMYSLNYDFSKANFNIDNNDADVTAPTIDLDSLKLNKKEVKAGDTLTVSIKASDDKSGIDYIYLCYICPPTNNCKYIDLKYNPQTKLYEGKLNIDTSMDNGTWSLDYISCSDNANNNIDLYSTDYDFTNFSFKFN